MGMDLLVKLYMNMVRLHGTPISIDRDTWFIARVWEEIHEAMGIELKFNTTFHPQPDGQLEMTI